MFILSPMHTCKLYNKGTVMHTLSKLYNKGTRAYYTLENETS